MKIRTGRVSVLGVLGILAASSTVLAGDGDRMPAPCLDEPGSQFTTTGTSMTPHTINCRPGSVATDACGMQNCSVTPETTPAPTAA